MCESKNCTCEDNACNCGETHNHTHEATGIQRVKSMPTEPEINVEFIRTLAMKADLEGEFESRSLKQIKEIIKYADNYFNGLIDVDAMIFDMGTLLYTNHMDKFESIESAIQKVISTLIEITKSNEVQLFILFAFYLDVVTHKDLPTHYKTDSEIKAEEDLESL